MTGLFHLTVGTTSSSGGERGTVRVREKIRERGIPGESSRGKAGFFHLTTGTDSEAQRHSVRERERDIQCVCERERHSVREKLMREVMRQLVSTHQWQ